MPTPKIEIKEVENVDKDKITTHKSKTITIDRLKNNKTEEPDTGD